MGESGTKWHSSATKLVDPATGDDLTEVGSAGGYGIGDTMLYRVTLEFPMLRRNHLMKMNFSTRATSFG